MKLILPTSDEIPCLGTGLARTKSSILCAVALLGGLSLGTGPLAQAADFTWTGAISRDWFTPGNWNPSGIPGPGDSASVGTGLADAGAGVTVANLTLTSGTIQGKLTVTGAMNWSGGGLAGGGSAVVIPSSGTLLVSGGDSKVLYGVVTNAGIVRVAGQGLSFSGGDGGGQLINLPGGLIEVSADISIGRSGYLSEAIVNQGALRKSGGTGQASLSPPLKSSGIVDVESGNLNLGGGSSGSGFFTGAAGAVVSGNFALNGSLSVSNVVFSSINLGGTNGVLSGVIHWTGGALVARSSVRVGENGFLEISGSDSKAIYGVITNAGRISFNGQGAYFSGGDGGGQLINLPGGVLDVGADISVTRSGYSSELMVNQGTFRKSAGTNTASFSPPLNNSGIVDVESGALDLGGGSYGSGLFTGTTGAAMSGAFSVNGSLTVSNVVFAGLTLSGTNGVLRGVVDMTRGAFASRSSLLVATNGVLVFSSSDAKALYGVLTNQGTIRINGQGFYFSGGDGGGQLINLPDAQLDIAADISIGRSGYATELVSNQGTILKSAGTNTAVIVPPVYNSAAIDVKSGALSLGAGSMGDGRFIGEMGTALSGNYALNGTLSVSNVALINMTLGGTNGVLTGIANWTSGSLASHSSLVVATNGLLVMSSPDSKTISGVLTNAGRVQINGQGVRFSGGDGGGQLINLAGGILEASADVTISRLGYDSERIINQGTFLKSSGTNTAAFVPPLNNSGTIDVESGALSLGAGSSGAGRFTGTPGATLSGNFALTGTVSVSNIVFANMTLGGTNGVLTGQAIWTGGALASHSSLSIAAGSVLVFSSSAGKTMVGILTNAGTIRVSGDGLYFTGSDGGGQWINASGALLEVAGDFSIGRSGYNSESIINQGTLRKTSGTNTATMAPPFSNSGTVDVEHGTLSFSSGYGQSAGRMNFGLNSISDFGQIRINGHAQLGGLLSASLNGGYLPAIGSLFPVLTYSSTTGAFAGLALPSPVIWQTNSSSTKIELAVTGLNTNVGQLMLSTNSLSFGQVDIGKAVDLSLKLSNLGKGSLNISSITISNASFSIVSTNGPFGITAGASVDVDVRYTPSMAGTEAGELTINSDDPKQPVSMVTLTGTAVVPPVGNCLPPPSGLVAWWPGEGNASNRVGNVSAQTSSSIKYAAGEVGLSFDLNGTDGYVSTDLDVQPSAMASSSWEAWVYPTRLNYGSRQQILSGDDGGYDRSVLIEGGSSNFAVFTGAGVWQPVAATANQWQHLLVIFSPTNIVFYKNGVKYSLDASPAFGSSGLKLQIGRNPGFGEYFQGRIDEVSIYNRALSDAEAAALFAAGSAGKCPPGTIPEVPKPELSIRRSNTSVIISWPVSASGYALESTRSLAPQIQWSRVPAPRTTNGAEITVTLAPSQASEFFRLNTNSSAALSSPQPLNLPEDWVPAFAVSDSVQSTVSASRGGAVQLKNGATIIFPPGALPVDQNVRVDLLDLSEFSPGMPRDVYQVDIGGVHLAKPATLVLPYAKVSSDPAGQDVHVVRVGDQVEELTGTLDLTARTVTVATDHFSNVVVEGGSSYFSSFYDLDPGKTPAILPVPYYTQGISLWCFAAASQMMLKYYGVDVEPWDVARYFGYSLSGSPSPLRFWSGNYSQLFQAYGAKVHESAAFVLGPRANGYIIQQINAGRPVFVIVPLGLAFHAIVVVGYDGTGVYIHDPSGSALGALGLPEDQSHLANVHLSWKDWVLLMYPNLSRLTFPLPVWMLTLEGPPEPPPSLTTLTLDTGLLASGSPSGDLIVNRFIDSLSYAYFFWEGKIDNGYYFYPGLGFYPKNISNGDSLNLTLLLHNAAPTTASDVSVRVSLDHKEIYSSSAPIHLDPGLTRKRLEVFPNIKPFVLKQLGLVPGDRLLEMETFVGGQLTDVINVQLPIGPVQPTGVKKVISSAGVKITWAPNPEEAVAKLYYVVFRDGVLAGSTEDKGLVDSSGGLAAEYRVVAHDKVSGYASPASAPAALVPAGNSLTRGAATFVGNSFFTVTPTGLSSGGRLFNVVITATGATFTGADGTVAKLTWPEPPQSLPLNGSFDFSIGADGSPVTGSAFIAAKADATYHDGTDLSGASAYVSLPSGRPPVSPSSSTSYSSAVVGQHSGAPEPLVSFQISVTTSLGTAFVTWEYASSP